MSTFRGHAMTLLGTLAVLSSPAEAGERPAPAASSPVVACTLSSAEKRERRAVLERDLLPNVRAVDEIANGYVIWFDRAEGRLAQVASFVDFESRCCAFLDFAIRLDSGNDRIALELSGPEGTKEMLQPLIEKTAARPSDTRTGS